MGELKKILLTGTSGFIGSHVLKYILNKTDFNVVCLNRSENNKRLEFSIDGISDWKERISFVKHDLVNPINDIKELNSVDYVVNMASISDVELSIKSPSKVIIDNTLLICNLLNWVKDNNIEKFIHLSSVEVYGPYIDNLHLEWDTHICNNPYSASKAAQEDIVSSYWSVYKLPLAIVNTGDPFGETQPDDKYLPKVVNKILNSESVTIHASPDNVPGTRQWIYAGNLAQAILYCLGLDFAISDKDRLISKWNVCGETRFNNLEWAEHIAKSLDKELNYEFIDFHSSKLGHGLHYAMSGDKIKKDGFSPETDIFDAIKQTTKWYLDNKATEWNDI